MGRVNFNSCLPKFQYSCIHLPLYDVACQSKTFFDFKLRWTCTFFGQLKHSFVQKKYRWTCMLFTDCIEFCSEIETHPFFSLVISTQWSNLNLIWYSLYMVNMLDFDSHLQFIQPSLQTFFWYCIKKKVKMILMVLT